jgi:hypothetical protein
MRVFVVGTGRCGTCTFYQACKHITNFTVGHESWLPGTQLPEFPVNHIEIASHLYPHMGFLKVAYPTALWVHLRRDRTACVQSLANNLQVEVECFHQMWAMQPAESTLLAAEFYYDTLNRSIPGFMGLVSFNFSIDHIDRDDWKQFWTILTATGDFNKSYEEFSRKYNTTEHRGRDVCT